MSSKSFASKQRKYERQKKLIQYAEELEACPHCGGQRAKRQGWKVKCKNCHKVLVTITDLEGEAKKQMKTPPAQEEKQPHWLKRMLWRK